MGARILAAPGSSLAVSVNDQLYVESTLNPTDPVAKPKSSPVAVNCEKLVEFVIDVLPVPAGSVSSTYDGTVNVLAATGARQV